MASEYIRIDQPHSDRTQPATHLTIKELAQDCVYVLIFKRALEIHYCCHNDNGEVRLRDCPIKDDHSVETGLHATAPIGDLYSPAAILTL